MSKGDRISTTPQLVGMSDDFKRSLKSSIAFDWKKKMNSAGLDDAAKLGLGNY
jgi:hypothetical protein